MQNVSHVEIGEGRNYDTMSPEICLAFIIFSGPHMPPPSNVYTLYNITTILWINIDQIKLIIENNRKQLHFIIQNPVVYHYISVIQTQTKNKK